MIRVRTGSRLHFGLFAVPGQELPGRRRFGGLGLMVEQPGIEVRICTADRWEATGPSADRALTFARQAMATLSPERDQPLRLEVVSCPPQHSGLGVGTQLGLAVASGCRAILGQPVTSAKELAPHVGRGERSAIGIHGFDAGGFLVDGGKLAGETVSPLLVRYDFPREWPILLVFPPAPSNWHGARERQAFAEMATSSPQATDELCRIALMGVLPGLACQKFDLFAESLQEFNGRVGDLFAPAQGGRYAGAAVTEAIARLQAEGVQAVGQSSWGPTVFAILSPEQAARDWEHLARSWGYEALRTQARNTGAMVETV